MTHTQPEATSAPSETPGKAVVNGERKYHNTDAPYSLMSGVDKREEERLNAQHYGIKDYFGGNNCGAPWPAHPKKILEIGCGHGVWAREVCEQFPEAQVVGVDIVDAVKNRPSNFSFQRLNVIKDTWPFPLGSFDIVHCRFVALHVQNFKTLVERAIEATAPGGILMFEDQDQQLRADGKPLPYPAHYAFSVFHSFGHMAGVDSYAAPLIAPIILGTRQFDELHQEIVPAPMGPWTDNPKLHAIGEGIRTGLIEGAKTLNPVLFEYGMTQDNIDGVVKAMENSEHRLYMDQYFIWARKKSSRL
ncbi:S-adenosyl-L-methionine-dependent methyltransferase [Dacryopinax primogenitus]|uniref:S-adenosyl-L-methionine-dependent methyltransferase n=1 Tax=Dacryopinax primogenitus (strain DJM 731) TaxID=1858805 RepID=M5GCQ1_DACPD|nr:S-adenosyl-L-methionine-dependent methyltransferase [Dacryopinax primogenitus]EJU03997.1 S-adenosyl-L-methionine-dependent methyltransferase [Dacryopinax primogenitus]